jgi:hypothetical protein
MVMISAAAIEKDLIELKQEKLASELLVLNISYSDFEAAILTRTPSTITRIAAIHFMEPIKTNDELISQLSHFISDFDLHKEAYKSVFINWIGSHFTLIPASFYDPDKAREMLEFNVGNIEGEQILTSDVNDIKFIYSVPADLKNFLDKTFPNHNFKHIGYSSLKLFFSHFQLKNADIFLNIHKGQTEVLIKKDKRPVLYNMFKTQSDEDILYFLMFSVEQFDLDPQTLKLYISANRGTNDPLFTAIKKYIRNVDHTVSDKLIIRKEAFEKLPHHYYFSALNRLLCE